MRNKSEVPETSVIRIMYSNADDFMVPSKTTNSNKRFIDTQKVILWRMLRNNTFERGVAVNA